MNQNTNCDQCQFKTNSSNDLSNHKLKDHFNPELIECRHCDYKIISVQNIKDHKETDHVEFAILDHIVSSQTVLVGSRSVLGKSFELFKDEMIKALNTITAENNAIKQELFILRQAKIDDSKKLDNIEKSVVNLTNVVSEGIPAASPLPPNISAPSTSKGSDP